ncbi:MAG: DUF4838 domain-containing protein, partial [Armatimonadota bacterium]
TLAESGETDYLIVIPVEPTTREQKAAQDLAHWLREMTGAEFRVVSDAEAPTPREICLGNTNRAAPPGDLGDEGYSIVVDGERIILQGGRLRGPIYAVYALLEEDLGLRWYAPGADRIPRRPTVKFRPVPRHYVPRLTIRDPFYRAAFDGTWSLRNRTNAPSAPVPEEWGGHVTYAAFVHTVHRLVPPDEHFEAHPEWFMLTPGGERSAHQLCMTHPGAIRAAIEGALRLLRAQPKARVISVSKTDGGRTCKCPKCKALDEAEGSESASDLYLVNRVAEAIEKEFPEVTVSTLAYLETVRPPKTIRPRRNVAIRLCTDNCMWAHPFTPARESPAFSAAMEAWSAIHDQIHIWDYVVNFSHYTAPMPNMDVIADNIRYFTENNATGIMTQGAYQSPGAERDAMRSWVIAKLLWDPSRDVWRLVHDFIYGYFGRAAPPIWEYNMLLRKAGADHAEALASPKGGIRYGMDHEFLSDALLARATELYDRAERLARDDATVSARVQRDRLPLMYVKLCRGPDAYEGDYSALVDRFEKIAKEVGLTHIAEGPPDVEAKIQAWRRAARE